MQLYEDQPTESKAPSNAFEDDLFGLESAEAEWSDPAEDALQLDEGGWSDWHYDVRPFIEKLHTPTMTLPLAKELWSSYRLLVIDHPEIAAFLRTIFRQIGPFLYLDHLETLYYDIVATNQLTTVIGRNMVQQYITRSDFASAESVLADLRAANQQISGSTISMILRSAGYAGDERKVWQYFDEQVQTKAFAESSYAYFCGSLFIALGKLPGNHEAHVTSIFQLMMSKEEYYPNSPEYYRWLETHNAHPSQAQALAASLHKAALEKIAAGDDPSEYDPSTMGMPDFPMQPPVRLPPPDAFCCNVIFPALRSVEAIYTTWEYVQKLRRITPHVYANYITSLMKLDLPLAIKAFKEYLLSSYAKKASSKTSFIRLNLMKQATEVADLASLEDLISIKVRGCDFRPEDITNLITVKIRNGVGGRQVLDEAAAMHDAHKLGSLAHSLRCIILEYLLISKPEEAQAALSHAKELQWKIHFHHQTPIPLWYFHEWLNALETHSKAPSDESKARADALEAKFIESNEDIFASEIGPSSFYIRVISTLHPSLEAAKQIIDRAIATGITARAVVFSITSTEFPLPFERAYQIVSYLCSPPHHGVFAPIIAKPLLISGSAENKFKDCFDIAELVIQKALDAHESLVPPAEGKEMPSSFIRGSWVHLFSVHVLSPLGISTYLHRFYGFHKYDALTKDQTLELRDNLVRLWRPQAERKNFTRTKPYVPPPRWSTPKNTFKNRPPRPKPSAADPRTRTPQL